MIMNTVSPLQLFTFDKETEKKTGVLTMPIFSACLLLFPMILMAIAGIGLDLGGYLLSEMTSISISDGAIAEQMKIIYVCVKITFCFGLVLVYTYGVSALRHLLFAYAFLPDGHLIKLKWKFTRGHSMPGRGIAREIARHTTIDRATAHQAVGGIYAFFEGIQIMHSPLVIVKHLEGSVVSENIISIPLDNVTVLKKTKKNLVIMADMLVKNKPKRKKLKIYWMYYDMGALCNLCERGGSFVNQ